MKIEQIQKHILNIVEINMIVGGFLTIALNRCKDIEDYTNLFHFLENKCEISNDEVERVALSTTASFLYQLVTDRTYESKIYL